MTLLSTIAEKYDVRGVLGEGGTGVVYDAIRREDERAIALKVMHASLAGDEQIRGRFRREAAILRRLEGRHVCPMLDFGEVDADGEAGKTLLYIALPKIEGPSLERLLRDEKPFSVERGIAILLEIADALTEAHARGIIHRDLKPANVLLPTMENGETKVLVVDFGMSKIITGTGSGTTNLTAHNMLFGTPEYMSPEQARGDELDGRCDVYAAGIILYEILTGAPPFTGPTPLGVLTLHLTSALEPPSKRAAEGRVTPALDAVALHALARDPARRYASAADFATALKRARDAPDDVEGVRPSVTRAPEAEEALASTVPVMTRSAPPPKSEERSVTPPFSTTLKSPRSSTPPVSRSSRVARPAVAVARGEPLSKTWVAVWVAAATASVGLGIYLALR